MSCSICRAKKAKMQKTNRLAETLAVDLDSKFLPLCFPCISIFNRISKQQGEIEKLNKEMTKTFVTLRNSLPKPEDNGTLRQRNSKEVTQGSIMELREKIKECSESHLKSFENTQEALRVDTERFRMKRASRHSLVITSLHEIEGGNKSDNDDETDEDDI